VYTLSPLSVFKDFIKLTNNASLLIKEIDSAVIRLVETTFDDLLGATQKFNDFMERVEANKTFIKESQWDIIHSKAQAIKRSEVAFRDGLKTKLKEIRNGRDFSIQDVVDDFVKSECSPRRIDEFMDAHNWLIARFGQISKDKAKGMWREWILFLYGIRI